MEKRAMKVATRKMEVAETMEEICKSTEAVNDRDSEGGEERRCEMVEVAASVAKYTLNYGEHSGALPKMWGLLPIPRGNIPLAGQRMAWR